MSNLKYILVFMLSALLLACTPTSVTKKNTRANFTNEVYVHNLTDRFTGVSTCTATREVSYIDELLSTNLGFNVKCGNKIQLIWSNSLSVENTQYFGLSVRKTGGTCSVVYEDEASQESSRLQSYWNYNDKRSKSESLFYIHHLSPESKEIVPKPMAVQKKRFLDEFLFSEADDLYVRLGGSGSQVVIVDKYLAREFKEKCIFE